MIRRALPYTRGIPHGGSLAPDVGGSPAIRFAVGITLLALILSLALGGCGKKNAPQPPPDVPNTYPRPYPSE
jgi:hypothetical protein